MSSPSYKVSVLVAAYNVGQYIRACMDSLVNQTLSPIEIIAIDDHSTDNTPTILQDYARYSFVKVVRMEKNIGLCGVRKQGVRRAQGAYIAFVDGDDYVEHSLCEKLYEKAIQQRSEITIGAFYIFSAHKGPTPASYYIEANQRWIQAFNRNTISIAPIRPHSLWGKLFHRSLFDEIKRAGFDIPDRLFYSEDLGYFCVLMYFATRLAQVDRPLYYYRQKPVFYKKNFLKEITITIDKITAFFEQQGAQDKSFKKTLARIIGDSWLHQMRLIATCTTTDTPKKILTVNCLKGLYNWNTHGYFTWYRKLQYMLLLARKIPLWYLRKALGKRV